MVLLSLLGGVCAEKIACADYPKQLAVVFEQDVADLAFGKRWPYVSLCGRGPSRALDPAGFIEFLAFDPVQVGGGTAMIRSTPSPST